MANLTGQAIQNTYPGLLNLATATTGITTTPQQIQDGLGNNTGTRIGTNFLTNPTVFGMTDYKADYYGVGFSVGVTAPVANTQNILIGNLFYDNGTYDYSAMTYNVASATSTSDVVTIAFYSTQYVDGVGVAPSVLIQSGITLSSAAPLGVKVTSLPSALSFSGYGPGYYFMMMKISNGGVTPTVRYNGSPQSLLSSGIPSAKLGFVINPAGTSSSLPSKGVNTNNIAYSGLTNFQTSFSAADVRTFSSTVVAPQYGFVLNTIK